MPDRDQHNQNSRAYQRAITSTQLLPLRSSQPNSQALNHGRLPRQARTPRETSGALLMPSPQGTAASEQRSRSDVPAVRLSPEQEKVGQMLLRARRKKKEAVINTKIDSEVYRRLDAAGDDKQGTAEAAISAIRNKHAEQRSNLRSTNTQVRRQAERELKVDALHKSYLSGGISKTATSMLNSVRKNVLWYALPEKKRSFGLFTLSNWTKEGTRDIDAAMSRADADAATKAAYKRNKTINKDAQKNVDAATNRAHGATALNTLSGVAGMGVTAATGGNIVAGAGTKVAMHALAGGLHQMEATQHEKAAEIFNKRAAAGSAARQEHRNKTAEAGLLLEGDLHQQREITMMRGRGEQYKAADARNARNKDGISVAFAATGASPLVPSRQLGGLAESGAQSMGAGSPVQGVVQRTAGAITKQLQRLLLAKPAADHLEDRSARARGYGQAATALKENTFTRSARQEAKLASRLNARNQLNAFRNAATASENSASRESEIRSQVKPNFKEIVKNRLATGQLSPDALPRHMRRRVK